MLNVGDKCKLSMNAYFAGGLEILAGTEVLVHKVDTSIPGITQIVVRVGMFQFTASSTILQKLEAPTVPPPVPVDKVIRIGSLVEVVGGEWPFRFRSLRSATKGCYGRVEVIKDAKAGVIILGNRIDVPLFKLVKVAQ